MSEIEVTKQNKIPASKLVIGILTLIIIMMGFFSYLYINRISPVEMLPTGDFGAVDTPKYLFSIEGLDEKGFSNPMGVASGGKDIYIADSSNHRVVIAERNGKLVGGFGGYGTTGGKLNYPVSIAVGEDRLYVADLHNNRIAIFTKDGKFITSWPNKETPHLNGIRPLALAITTNQKIYVSDSAKQRLLVLDSDGKQLKAFGGPGSANGQFAYPNGLAIDEEHQTLFVADSNNRRVQAFSLEGEFKSVLAGQLLTPRGIAYNSENGKLYVVDTMANQVMILNTENPKEGMLSFNQVGEKDSLQFPHGITVDSQGRIFVTEKQTNRISVYR